MPCNCNNRRSYNSNNRPDNSNVLGAGTAACQGNSNQNNPNYPSRVIGLTDLELATCYVVPQVYTQSYTPEKALEQGTCFPELDMEY